MRIRFIVPLWFAACFRFSMTIAFAQPSVYSGVFAYQEGGLTTSSDWQAVTNFVANAQKDVSIINNFDSWTDSGSSTNATETFPTTEMTDIRSHGSIPMFTWQPQNGNEGTNQSFDLANIINRDYDTYITDWAAAAKAWGHPFFLRFAHEMNGYWYPWCAGVNGNTPSQYVQMWQHVHNIFTSVGATNVTWVWCVDTASSTPIAELYPGDNYVDWLALDGYNRLANPWEDFSTIAAATVAGLTNLAPGKPIMVAETGCNQNTNHDKAQWFLNALTNYLPSEPRIKAWVYFDSTNAADGNDWQITDPSSAVVGYQQGIALSYYDTNQYGAISSSPIQPLLNDATTTDTMGPFVSIVSPATDLVTNGTVIGFVVLASDKSGVSNVVFSLNGVVQQTNNFPPYQFYWTVPAQGGPTYTVTATAYDNAGNSAVSTVQAVSQSAAAPTNILQTTSESSPDDWNSAIWGSPAAVPVSTNNYETPNGYAVRTSNINTNTSNESFFGNLLQIDAGGILYLKHNNSVETVNLVLNGGEIDYHGAPGGTNSPLGGTLQVLANSTVTSDQNGVSAANVDIWLLSNLTGSGNLTVAQDTATNALVLFGNNSAYSGNWTNTGGFIEIGNGTTNALGSGSVTLVNTGNYLDFDSTNNLTVANKIMGTGYLILNNTTGSVTLTANNTFTGELLVNAGTLMLAGSGAQSATFVASNSVLCIANSSAVPSGSTLTVSPNNAQTGELQLSNNVTLATGKAISVSERTGPSVAIESVSGNNIISDQISISSGGSSPIAIQADGGATLSLNGGITSGVTGARGVLFAGAGSGSVSGGITNGSASTVAVYKTGPGSWTLNNANTYTGPTIISNGVLQLGAAGSIAGTPTIQLSSGAILNVAAVSGGFALGTTQTLAGVGSVTGNITVNGTVSPGPLGTLTFADGPVLSGTAVLGVNRTNTPNSDRLAANSISFGGALTVTNLGGALQAGDSFQLFSGALSSTFAATNLPALSSSNLYWDTSKLGSQGILAVALEIAAPPTILRPSWNGTNFTLQVNSQTGFAYVLQATTRLAPANWTAVQTSAGGGLVTFAVPISAGTQQFFRVWVP